MNIFYLDRDPARAAVFHVDKHVVKMILEYAQLLSAAHRLLDGRKVKVGSRTFYLLADEQVVERDGKSVIENPTCYGLSHASHPCAVWARESAPQYHWLFKLFQALLAEYTHRYGKVHSATKLVELLHLHPLHMSEWTWRDPPQAMPDECKRSDTVEAYRSYYVQRKVGFAKWKNREVPTWFLPT